MRVQCHHDGLTYRCLPRLLIALALTGAGMAFASPGFAQTMVAGAGQRDSAVKMLPPLPPAEIDNNLAITGTDIGARKVDSRMTVGVKVEGHGPFRFVVDSGADTSALGSRDAPVGCDCQRQRRSCCTA